jgi:hypothetical protein
MFLAIIFGAVIFGIIIAVIISDDGECPREIYGYSCKGKNCDHSIETIEEAKWAMDR